MISRIFRLLFILLLLADSSRGEGFKKDQVVILMLGDSLTEGMGVMQEEAYPYLAEEILREGGLEVKLINAGVSGSTSKSAVTRLRWYLKLKPDYLFLALGANDALRGLPLDSLQENLESVIALARKNGIKVLLAGMKVPPNYSKTYANAFEEVFYTLKEKYAIRFLPFLLEGVGGVTELNLADGIHPNRKGHKLVARLVAEFLSGVLENEGAVSATESQGVSDQATKSE